jgi:signal transduction histidine kinase
VLAVPIASSARVHGWLCLTGKIGLGEFAEEDERLASHLGALIGRIFESGEAEQALHQRAEAFGQAVAERTSELETANRRLRDQMEALQRAQAALEEVHRMEAIGQLTGGIAHDFNNLLTAIMGGLDLVRRHTEGDSAMQRIIDTAQRAATRGARLTTQLLSFARLQPLQPAPTDLNEFMRDFRQLIALSVGEAVEIVLDLDAGLWSALVDPAHLQAAVLNLVVNARDAMPKGGRLFVETRNVVIEGHVAEPLCALSGAYVLIAIRDTGVGVAPDVAARAFEPFFTTKEVGQGTGLGLSQVYGFARQSGGCSTLESVPGQGTTVRIYLPCSPRRADPAI